jgi:CysZ protein
MQRFLSEFKDGINAYFEAVGIIRTHRLWIFLLIPGFISLLFGGLMVYGAIVLSGEISTSIGNSYPWEFGADFVRKAAGFLGAVLVWAGALFTYKYVVLILVAPFMSPLSERVERLITGRQGKNSGCSPVRAARELWRGIRISLRNIIRELLLTVLILIVSAILPFLAIFGGPLIFAVQAYFAGFGNIDFTLERHLGVRGSVRFIRNHKGLAVGNGVIFVLLLMIPVVGLFLAPGLSTVAGTIRTVEHLGQR